MKTIIHLTLSDLERGHLANLLDAKKSSRLVTRAEVIDICFQAVFSKVEEGEKCFRFAIEENGNGQAERVLREDDGEGLRQPDESKEQGRAAGHPGRHAGEGDSGVGGPGNDNADGPTPAKIRAACKRVIKYLDEEDDDALNLGWCASVLLATGIK